jgi:hypothetical protein
MVGLESYGWRRIASGLLLLVLATLVGLASHTGNLNVQAAPANDDLANAAAILSQPYTIQQSTTGATTEGAETTSYTTCTGVFASTTIGSTVWYKWTAPSSMTILLDSIGSTADSVLAVYSGPASSPTYPGLTLVGCSSQEFSSNDAGVSFSATSGTTYYFQVGGYFANNGETMINLGTVPATIGTTFVVDSAGDGDDVTIGNGFCNAAGGICTLRAAVEESNALAGVNFIRFAVGTGPITIASALGSIAITSPVNIDARTQPGFGAAPIVDLSGTASSGDGFNITTSAATIRGFVINGFTGSTNQAVYLGSSGNVIQGNYIGTNAAGTAASANNLGINVDGSSNNTIGGITDAARNVISGNTVQAVYIKSGSGNQVMGNYIGTSAFGFGAIANGGGTGRGAVQLSGADTNTIGGTLAGAGNLISGNTRYGVGISELGGGSPDPATGNVVQGNRIGTDINGAISVPNVQGGIFIGGGTNSTVGGSGTAANTVAYNGGPGIAVSLDGDPSHTSASATGNKLTGNSIHDNTGLGIDLNADGVTANDTGDADTGPNNRQNFPLLTGAFASGSATAVKGSLNSTASTGFTIEYFSSTSCDASGNGEGATFLASVTTTTDGTGNVSFTNTGLPLVSVGNVVTATATRNSSPFDTSEFSACATVCSDNDSDQVCNSSDNCPNWSNTAQALPTWPVPTGDTDCDGFPDSAAASGKAPESYIGTDPLQHCAATPGANDESGADAMPPDFNDDQAINGADTGKYGGPGGAGNHTVAQGPFNGIPGVRFDFNGDGVINGQDVGKFSAYFNKLCT